MTRRATTTMTYVGAAAAAAAGAWATPSVTAYGPLRRAFFPDLAGVGSPHHVALTFDDGPDPASTPAFIRELDRLQVHATFFLLGRMLARHPHLGADLVAAGHEVALHGWDHRVLLSRGQAATRDDLVRAHQEITGRCGTAPMFYRPPYGVLTWPALRTARDLGMTPVLWSAWGRDWRRIATAESVLDDVSRDLGGGGTVLLHDSDCTSSPGSWRTTLRALPRMVGHIRNLGLEPGPLREHGLIDSVQPHLGRTGS